MIRNILFTLLFFISLVVTFATFITGIAMGKEGIGIEDLGRYGCVAAVFAGIILIWYLISKWKSSDYVKSLGYISIAINCIPLFLTLWLLVSLIQNDYQSKSQSKHAVISRFQESFIKWPGFTYPVGLRIDIDMPTPFAVNIKRYAGFYSPVIWMGPQIAPEIRRQIFAITFGWTVSANDNSPSFVMLKGILNNKIKPPAPNIASQGDSKIIFDLYPSAIEYLENSNGFCTYSGTDAKDVYANEVPPNNYASGRQLNAMWYYAGKNYVDLSDQLSLALQKSSQLENNPTLWVNIQRQFDDYYLFSIGYHQCVLATRTHCFCK